MQDRHHGKYLSKMFLGFVLVTAGIFLVSLGTIEARKSNWYFWASGSAIVVNAGLYFLFGACVHKVKSDLIRRQKQRDHRKPVEIS
ncbi:MAG TPA: hypothetical protein VEB63_08945 [Chitinophagaceae bacterium]|nr:hypothetical protein [Chitinophagaceae bacterium]